MILQTGDDRDRAGQNAEGNRDRDEPQCSSDLAPAVICHVRWSIALHVTRLLTFEWPQTVAQVAGLTGLCIVHSSRMQRATNPSSLGRPSRSNALGVREQARRLLLPLLLWPPGVLVYRE